MRGDILAVAIGCIAFAWGALTCVNGMCTSNVYAIVVGGSCCMIGLLILWTANTWDLDC